MAIRSIPVKTTMRDIIAKREAAARGGGEGGNGQFQYKPSTRPVQARRRSNGTLSALLARAEKMALEQAEVVKALPDDEELEELDRRQRMVFQLRIQTLKR